MAHFFKNLAVLLLATTNFYLVFHLYYYLYNTSGDFRSFLFGNKSNSTLTSPVSGKVDDSQVLAWYSPPSESSSKVQSETTKQGMAETQFALDDGYVEYPVIREEEASDTDTEPSTASTAPDVEYETVTEVVTEEAEYPLGG